MIEYQDERNNFANEVRALATKYKDRLPAYEMIFRLISEGVLMSLCCSPNKLVGVKTIISCVQSGIQEYEETHS